MGADSINRKLLELCCKSFNVDKMIEDLTDMSEESPLIFLGLDYFKELFPGRVADILLIKDVFLLEEIEGYETKYLQTLDPNCSYIVVFLGIKIGGFKLSSDYKMYEEIRSQTISLKQPVQEFFAKHIPEITPKIIKPFFRDHRHIEMSLIVLTGLNNAASLKTMLTSLKEFTPACTDLEIIVIINGSYDESMELPNKIFDNSYNLKIIYLTDNVGIAGGFNEGIAVSRGKYICLLQDDITFTQFNWHQELAYYLDRHNRIGVIGGFRAMYYYARKGNNGLECPFLGIGSNLIGGCDWPLLKQYVVQSDVASCMVMMFRRELGFYDEHYIPNGLEDIAFSYETQKKGFDVFVTDIGVIHGLRSATRFIHKRLTVAYEQLYRGFQYQYFMNKYGSLLRTIPNEETEEKLDLKSIEPYLSKFPKDWPSKSKSYLVKGAEKGFTTDILS